MLLVLLALAAGEKFLRRTPELLPATWQVRRHVKTLQSRFVPDAELGFVLPPHQQERVDNTEYTYVRETDAYGFPNRQPWPERADIVFLGDSLITGQGVGIDGQFTTLVQRMLPQQRVVNLGMPAAGPERQYRIYRAFGADLRPRWVVTCWYLSSDLSNDVAFHAWLHDQAGMDYDRFRLTYKRRMDARPRFHPGRIPERSALYALGRELVQGWRQEASDVRHRWRFADDTEILFDYDELAFGMETVAADDLRVERTFTSLKRLQTAAQQHQAEVLVMLIPSKEELFGIDADAQNANAVARVRHRLQAARIPTLDVYAALRGAARAPYFRRDIHLNHYGNRLVAEQFVMWWQAHAP
jgi:hypothetical protein